MASRWWISDSESERTSPQQELSTSAGLRGVVSEILKRKREATIAALQAEARDTASDGEGANVPAGPTAAQSLISLVESTSGGKNARSRTSGSVRAKSKDSSSRVGKRKPPTVTFQKETVETIVVIPQPIRQSAADAYFRTLQEIFPDGRKAVDGTGQEVAVDHAALTLEKETEMFLASKSVVEYRSMAAGLLRRLRKGDDGASLPRRLIPTGQSENEKACTADNPK